MNKSTEARFEAVKKLHEEARDVAYGAGRHKSAAEELSALRARASESHLIAEVGYKRSDGYPRPMLQGSDVAREYALRLAETEPRDYVFVCTPTGDELPEMFAHWRSLGELLGKPILPVMGSTLAARVAHYNALPNWRQRWCTRELKIEPYARWLSAQLAEHSEVVSYVGLRADEPEREGGDYARLPGVTSRFPMREWGWGLSDVLSYLVQRGITIPARTDCARCFYQTLGQWWDLWKQHPEIYADAECEEAMTRHTYRSPGRDTWPAALVELRREFERGRTPTGAEVQRPLLAAMQCRVCRL